MQASARVGNIGGSANAACSSKEQTRENKKKQKNVEAHNSKRWKSNKINNNNI